MTDKSDVLKRLEAARFVAIVRLNSASGLAQVAEALLAGGVQAMEFTVTTPGAFEILQQVSQQMGDRVLLGAGTILDVPTALTAIRAGARYLVSPHLNPEIIRAARRWGVVSIPGAFTPTEIVTAWESGADMVKVFPCGSVGPRYIKEILAPLPQVKVMAVGGVDVQTAPAFFQAGATAVGVGAALVDGKLVQAGRFDEITARAQQFLAAIAGVR